MRCMFVGSKGDCAGHLQGLAHDVMSVDVVTAIPAVVWLRCLRLCVLGNFFRLPRVKEAEGYFE
jgi:hypothetical protein